jgi:serine/threonine protein kinase
VEVEDWRRVVREEDVGREMERGTVGQKGEGQLRRQTEHELETERRTQREAAFDVASQRRDRRESKIGRQTALVDAEIRREAERAEARSRELEARVRHEGEIRRQMALVDEAARAKAEMQRETERVETRNRELETGMEHEAEHAAAEALKAAAEADEKHHKKRGARRHRRPIGAPETRGRGVYLHIARLDRTHAVERYREYVSGGRLGAGAFGEVSATCRMTSAESCSLCRINKRYCPYALKVVQVEVGRDGILPLAGVERDVYYLQKLRDVRVDGKPVVPVFYDAWMQDEAVTDPENPERKYYPYYLVLERFDGDMSHLAKERFRTWDGRGATPDSSALYHESELTRMFRIAARIGVSDGDIKPDQFLFIGTSSMNAPSSSSLAGTLTPPARNIVLTDFGFAGEADGEFAPLLGWPADDVSLGCPTADWDAPDRLKNWPQLLGDPAHTNVLLLEMYLLVYGGEPLVAPDDSDARGGGGAGVRIFGGIRGLDRDAYASGLCRNYTNAYVRNLSDRPRGIANDGPFTLDMASLVSPASASGDDRKTAPSPSPTRRSLSAARLSAFVAPRETNEETQGRSYDSVRIRREEDVVVELWDAVVRALGRQPSSVRPRIYRRLSRIVRPDEWSHGTVPDYAEIVNEPHLKPLRPELDAFWSVLSTRRLAWSPEKLAAFLELAFKHLDAKK